MGRGDVFPADQARSLLHPLRRLVQSPARTVRAAGPKPTDIVLEVGAGPGFFSVELAAAVPGGMLVMADLQLEMLRMGAERVKLASAAQVDAQALPFRDGSIDLVLLATMLGEVPDRAAAVREVHRVLRPSGVLAVAETRRDSDFIPVAELRMLVEPAGYRFLSRRGLAWQYVARFEARA